MPFDLALFQAGSMPSQELYIILGVITLATVIALGLRFFVNIFEVITAPAASLRHHGQSDNFFFSIFVVFLGGLIGAFGLLAKQSAMTQAFHEYATTICNDVALQNANANYRDIAASWGVNSLDSHFNILFTSNLVFFPIVMVVLWLFVGTVCYLGARMLGSQSSYGDFLGSLAYSSLFASIGLGFVALFGLQSLAAYTAESSASPGVLAIIGLVLLVYALVLFLMGISQGADLAGGQVAGVLVVLVIVLGGIGAGIFYYAQPVWQSFTAEIQSYDPSRGSY